MSLMTLSVWAIVMIVVTVLDYVVPPIITKRMGGTKYAERGSIYGMILGMILTPIGMILGAFLGAFAAELIVAKRQVDEALKAALGTFIGFILGTGIKTITAVCILWNIIVYIN